MTTITPVIMAGGSGTRLWPLSRQLYPKQFLALAGSGTMLQETCARIEGLGDIAPVVICGEDHRFTVAEQLRLGGYEASAIVLEPEGKNTAPAVALAAFQALKQSPGNDEPILLVLAADHVILNIPAFQEAVRTAVPYAQNGSLATFGILPDKAETGYGYIKQGGRLGNGDASQVSEFVEKPDQVTADNYLDSGDYLWNSGMFLFGARRYLEELQQHCPEIYQACEKAMKLSATDQDFVRPEADCFAACPSDSIDYAVMEKTDSAVVVPMDCGWSDVGSWSALWEVSGKDADGNTINGDVLAIDNTNCYIQSDKKLVATIGLNDIVVVESDDAIMVAAKSRVQDVKSIVEQLKKDDRSEAQLHRKVFRPWGYYDSIDSGQRFLVKRIVVKPEGRLSLQMHHHRAEHWIVVSGTAKVTIGDKTFFLSENESTFIPIGETHRLENPGNIPLEMIEVQSGSYLGEDDIVRFEDTYGRS